MQDGKGISVLFIDDDSLFVDAICHGMGEEGLSCAYAPSGGMALDLLAKGPLPDIVLLDLTMPDMDGFEVLKKLKEDSRTASIPVIIFSNDANQENVDRTKQLGGALFLEKVRVVPSEIAEQIKNLAHK